jgi:hypothetical protein
VVSLLFSYPRAPAWWNYLDLLAQFGYSVSSQSFIIVALICPLSLAGFVSLLREHIALQMSVACLLALPRC